MATPPGTVVEMGEADLLTSAVAASGRAGNGAADWKPSAPRASGGGKLSKMAMCGLLLAGLTVGAVVTGISVYFANLGPNHGKGVLPGPAPPSLDGVSIVHDALDGFFDNRGFIVITISGLADYYFKGGWVGLFPAGVDIQTIDPMGFPTTPPWTAPAPIKFMMLETLGYTNAFFPMQVINSYNDYQLALFVGGTVQPVFVTNSTVLRPRSTPPLRPRLSRPSDDPSTMRLTWHAATNAGNPTVRWGTSSGVYTSSAPAVAATYTQADMTSEPARSIGWLDPHYFLSATMTGLVPGTTYYYTFGSDAAGAGGWGEEGSFTAVQPAGHATNMNILVYGDSGVSPLDGSAQHWQEPFSSQSSARLREAASTGAYSMALHLGDLAYATGYGGKWAWFEENFECPIARSVPVQMLYGNHERAAPGTGSWATTNDSGGEGGIPMAVRWPAIGWNGNATAFRDAGWYSFTQGPAAFFIFNSELPMEPGSPQWAWADAAMAAVDRTVTPWLIAAWHRPLYLADQITPQFQSVEPLMLAHHVDLVLNGHMHYAFRTCPVANSTCVNTTAADGYDAPIWAIVGNAGQSLYSPPLPGTSLPYAVWQQSDYGYADIKFAGATGLTMTYYGASDGSVRHSFTISRSYPRVAPAAAAAAGAAAGGV